MKNKRGISLIMLVITIIIIIILAGSIILNLSKNNFIYSAQKASFLKEVNEYDSELKLWISNEYTNKLGNLDISTINATKDSGTYNKDGNIIKIKDIVKSIKTEDENKFSIIEGKLQYIGDDENERQWASNVITTGKLKFFVPPAPERVNPTEFGYIFDIPTKTITGYTGTVKDIIIPKTFLIDGVIYDVLNIGDNAFNDKGLTKLVLSSNIKRIGKCAFRFNSLIEGVILDSNLDYAGNMSYPAFGNCAIGDKLTITENVTKLPDNIFYGAGLTSITLPSSLTSFGSYIFADNSITAFNIPTFMTTIPTGFLYHNNLTKITIPNYVKSLGNDAFRFNSLTEGVILDSNLDYAGNMSYPVFGNCAVGDKLTITGNVTKLPDNIFYGAGLTSITLPSSLASFGSYIFADNSITAFNIPTFMTAIPTGFLYCNNLTKITIPNYVKSLGNNAFKFNSLTEGVILDSNLDYAGNMSYPVFGNCAIGDKLTITGNVTKLPDNIFYGADLTSITVPASVVTIGSYVFMNNKISQGSAIIKNVEENVSIGSDVFRYNGTLGNTTITPLYLP